MGPRPPIFNKNRLGVDRALGDSQRGFFEGFGEGGVSVRSAAQVFGTGGESDGGRGFGDEVTGARANDVNAE